MGMKWCRLMYYQMLLTWTLNSCPVFSISHINVFKCMSVTGWYLSIPPSSFSAFPSPFLHHSLPLSIHLCFVPVLSSGSAIQWYLPVPYSCYEAVAQHILFVCHTVSKGKNNRLKKGFNVVYVLSCASLGFDSICLGHDFGMKYNATLCVATKTTYRFCEAHYMLIGSRNINH